MKNGNENINNYNKIVRNEESGAIDNPFGRSSVITRSPPANVVNDEVPAEHVAANVKEYGESINKLGEKISQLLNFVTIRTNVHKEIVTMTREVQALFIQLSDQSMDYCLANDSNPRVNAYTQTAETESAVESKNSPSYEKNPVINKYTQTEDKVEFNCSEQPRKRGPTTQSPKGNKAKRKKNTNAKKDSSNDDEPGPSMPKKPETLAKEAPKSEWQKVRSKTERRTRMVRPDALVIKVNGNLSYADILKQVKNDPKLKHLGENVRSIRKTGRGELLLQLNKSAHENVNIFKHSVENTLGSSAEVRALTHEIFVEIKDIDEITTGEDVLEALRNVSDNFESLTLSCIKSIRKAYGGTQTATIALSAGLANHLIKTSKIRIGWVVCRIREKIRPIRCYKCFDFGHTTHKCKSQLDYSDKCLQCGGIGHKIGMCPNKPSCLLCKKENENGDHVAGCMACPYYKKAVQLLRLRK